MNKIRERQDGFTVIELLVFILVITTIAVIGISNVRSARAESRDTASKKDINAIYYQLEAFHERNGYYPDNVDAKILTGIDPESLKDKNGIAINQAGGVYVYKPASCGESKCKSFQLTTQLEKEAPFTKQSLNKQ